MSARSITQMSCLRFVAVAIVLCSCEPRLAGASQASPPVDQPSTALVQVVVDSTYSTPKSLEDIRLIAAVAPPIEVPFPTGDTISALIARQYGFGPSDNAAAYAEIEAAVVRLNDIRSLTSISRKSLRLPALPRVGYAVHGPAAAAGVMLPKSEPSWALMAPPPQQLEGVLTQDGTATETIIQIEIPAASLRTTAGESLVALGRLQGAPMEVAFAAPARGSGARTVRLSVQAPDLLAAIRTLADSAQRTTRLFVLDSGWPPDYSAASRKSLAAFIGLAGKPFGLAAPPLSENVPLSGVPRNPHAISIADALTQYEREDKQNHVEVIFVPLSRDQGAGPLLEQLVAVSFAIQARRATKRGNELAPARLREIGRRALLQATQRVRALPRDATGKPFVTDKALLDAVWEVAQVASADGGWYFLVNESWTAPSGGLGFSPLVGQRGIAVAAAGNIKDRDVTELPYVHFAYQAVVSDYVIAVMNMDASGALQCESSVVGGSFLSTRAVGFDGRITGDCGTSFAAPRVAWLIAAGESLRKSTVAESLWPQHISEIVRASRKGGDGRSAFVLDPVRLLDLSAK